MGQFYFDDDADIGLLKGKTVAILGYGNQGRSQALNLRDSGVEVIVGSAEKRSSGKAVDDGFSVIPFAEAVAKADILFMLLPDEVMPRIYREHIAPGLRPGMVLNFAHGYAIHYGEITPPDFVDVILIGPRMIGKGVRDNFVNGVGFPSLVAVHQDATGHAKAMMLALSRGIGSTRMGVLETSFREETEIDLFSEQTSDIFIPMMIFEVLTKAGYDPDVVLLETYGSGEMSQIFGDARDIGLLHQLKLHSRTSQYGQVVAGKRLLDLDGMREQFTAIIEHINSGRFAREWKHEEESGFKELIRATDETLSHPMQKAEDRLYRILKRRDYDLDEAYWLKDKAEPGAEA